MSGQDMSTPTPSSSSSGISTGAAAGIGIGCAAAGAIIASTAWLIIHWRYKKRQRYSNAGIQHHLGPQTAPAVTESKPMNGKSSGAVVSSVETFLPQPAADDEISGELSRLRDKIKDHVQTYYHASPVDTSVLSDGALQEYSRSTGIAVTTIRNLLLNPNSRSAALRSVIAWAILSRSNGQGDFIPSLLPAEVATFAQAVSTANDVGPGQLALLTKWKAISAALLKGKVGSQDSSHMELLRIIEPILRPFATDQDQRLRNFESIVRRASQFAFLLFSQPSVWSFDWAMYGRAIQSGGLIIFPTLMQTVDETAQVRHPPRAFYEAEIVSGLGS